MLDQPKTDEEWEAERDANTLIDAEAIKSDPERMKKAVAAADKMLDELEEKARAAAKRRAVKERDN